MNNKLIFRILGALASALMIIAVFVPFVKVTGYSTSLWESYESINSLYLPIMIIVFGAIGVIFFSLNIKTEFAYMSVGAILFFIVIQTIDIINQNTFNTLSVGYYFLVIGTILAGVMAFLTNLRYKEKNTKVEEAVVQPEVSVLNQIDRLYDNQSNTMQNDMATIQAVNNVIEPIPVQPIQPTVQVQPIQEVQPIVQEQNIPNVVPVEPTQQQVNLNVAPAEPQQLNLQPVNPVVQEFTNVLSQEPMQTPTVQSVQPAPVVEQPVAQPLQEVAEPTTPNPVVQEFTNPGSTVMPQPNTNELDIFGQPINKS